VEPDPSGEAMKTITICAICSNEGCKRVGTAATKLSTFWINLCDECQGKTVTLDFDKIFNQRNDPRLNG
jgi:hypothetical protein